MTLYALVAADSTFAVDVFASRAAANAALADVLADEPAFEPLLSVNAILPPEPTASEREYARRASAHIPWTLAAALRVEASAAADRRRQKGGRDGGRTTS